MSYLRSSIQKVTSSFWLNLVFLVVICGVLIANSLFIGSAVIGIASSLVFLYMCSMAAGRLLFHNETPVVRTILGLMAYTSLLALIGLVLIFVGRFTLIISLIAVTAVSLVLFVLSARQKLRPACNPSEVVAPEQVKSRKVIPWLLTLTFLVLISLNFYLLLKARTDEGRVSVWLAIPNMFVPVFLATSFILAVAVLFTNIRLGFKLGLIASFSFLVHSLFLLVWYPGRYGDPWTHLAEARYVSVAGMPYAYPRMISGGLFVDILKYRSQQVLVVFFQRMFSIDIYWADMILIPLLWAVFVPFLSYKIAEMINTRGSSLFPLLAAISTEIFSTLVIWGAVAVPNSLGFLFFFLVVALFLYWKKERGKLLWLSGLMVSGVSFFAHPQTGMFAFMLFLWGTVLVKFRYKILKVLSFAVMFALYPFSMYYFGASFALQGLVVLENFIAFQSEISTILLAFGIVGLTLGVLGKYVKTSDALMLFGFYLTILFEYYVTRYGMVNQPYGPGRILVMSDMLFAPFVALGLLTVVDMLSSRIPSFSPKLLKPLKVNVRPYSIGVLLICLVFTVLVTSSLYRGYPRSEVVSVQPAAYELDAINYIRNDAKGNYVVLCSPIFASLATGFLGVQYSYFGGVPGWFGIPEYGYPPQKLYLEMMKNPSVSIMSQAMAYIKADVAYFVISEREPDFKKIVARVSDVLTVNNVVDNGRLYIFKYPIPLIEEPGPNIKTFFDEGLSAEYVPTNISYMFRSEANSTVLLTGHSSYNITEYPSSWTFLELTVNNVSSSFDPSSSADKFIYKSGLLPTDVLRVRWLSNLDYVDVGWKEDSFDLSQWHRFTGSITPTITSDGNILQMSWYYIPPNYNPYYYVRETNISTDDYRYIKVRWKSIGPVAAVHLYFEEGGQTIVQLGSESKDWTTTIVQLEPNKVIKFVMLGITNLANPSKISGDQSLFVDYILIGNRAP